MLSIGYVIGTLPHGSSLLLGDMCLAEGTSSAQDVRGLVLELCIRTFWSFSTYTHVRVIFFDSLTPLTDRPVA